MNHDRGWDEHSGTWGEFDNQFHIPENEVPPAGWVEIAKCSDGTPTIGQVGSISMLYANRPGTQVECCSWPYAVFNFFFQGGVVRKEQG